jgi:hypothetical protein
MASIGSVRRFDADEGWGVIDGPMYRVDVGFTSLRSPGMDTGSCRPTNVFRSMPWQQGRTGSPSEQ